MKYGAWAERSFIVHQMGILQAYYQKLKTLIPPQRSDFEDADEGFGR